MVVDGLGLEPPPVIHRGIVRDYVFPRPLEPRARRVLFPALWMAVHVADVDPESSTLLVHRHDVHPLGRRIVTRPVGPLFPWAGTAGNLSIWFHSRSLSVHAPAAVSQKVSARGDGGRTSRCPACP